MDPQLLTALISAGAALVGAIVGALATTLTARAQHIRSIRAESRKNERTRECAAAEACRVKIGRFADLTVLERDRKGEHEDQFAARQNECLQLDKELRVEELHLPDEARKRVATARELLMNASDLVVNGHFYASVSAIRTAVEEHIAEVSVAVIRETEVPARPDRFRQACVALNKHYELLNEIYAEDLHDYEEAERKWLAANPEAVEPASAAEPKLAGLRRKIAKKVSPDK
ncbi:MULTISPECIES: hypothetical protein [unclassified Pseudonocardia]|uniref:hypothetical protein n=1 Tax=unclassified Pseudonocardia TaxID=2619320 RepID=UPI0001FFE91A|nr:hypothetical protein [Pseudonocardia sp. Ae707_Ps1]OLM21312.1 hypothetical protein Ae707Ps1_5571 [Pseudonocardia sp. Ae707_Ps1]